MYILVIYILEVNSDWLFQFSSIISEQQVPESVAHVDKQPSSRFSLYSACIQPAPIHY